MYGYFYLKLNSGDVCLAFQIRIGYHRLHDLSPAQGGFPLTCRAGGSRAHGSVADRNFNRLSCRGFTSGGLFY